MGMGANDCGPLQEKLVAYVVFIFAHPVIRMRELEAQAIKLAHVPRNERRVANGLFAWT